MYTYVCVLTNESRNKWDNKYKWTTREQQQIIEWKRQNKESNEKHWHEARFCSRRCCWCRCAVAVAAVVVECMHALFEELVLLLLLLLFQTTTWTKRKDNTHSQSHERSSIIETQNTGTLNLSPHHILSHTHTNSSCLLFILDFDSLTHRFDRSATPVLSFGLKTCGVANKNNNNTKHHNKSKVLDFTELNDNNTSKEE